MTASSPDDAHTPRFPIFARILLATLVPLVVILSMVLFTINRVIYRSNVEAARENSVFAANQAATQIESTFDSLAGLVDATAIHLASVNSGSRVIDRDLALNFTKAFLQSSKNVHCGWLVAEHGLGGGQREGVYFVRRDDGVILGPRPLPESAIDSPALSPWYHIPKHTGQSFIHTADKFDYQFGKGPQSYASVSLPVKTPGGQPIGVVGVDVLYRTSFGFLGQWEESHQRRVFLISDNGTVLYSSEPEHRGKQLAEVKRNSSTVGAISEAIGKKERRLFEGINSDTGTRSLYFITPLNLPNVDHGLFLLSEVPVETAYHRAEHSFNTVLSTSVLGMILVAASVFLATRNIVKPIRKLTSTAERIANGELDVDLADAPSPEKPRHEVDQLVASMKKMLGELNLNHQLRVAAMQAEFEKSRLAQVSEAKERFFANMSHEIRTPMNAILGMSDLMLRQPLTDQQQKYARDIKLSSESLLGIINDILDLSKLESGKFPLHNVHYDLHSLLDNVGSICGFLAADKNIDFSMRVDPELPRFVHGDELRLKQVLLNVVGNGVKFTQRGHVLLSADGKNGRLEFAVSDTGRGIRKEDLRELFVPFKRFERDGESGLKGTGLGLSITAHLLELMGGEIIAESELGVGSTFHVRVPLVPGDPDRVERKEDDATISFSPEAVVLVVDDNRVNLDVAAGMIGLYGITCDKAKSGREALDKVAANRYDIIFMDHMMPGMDGVETTKRLREREGGTDLVIVALTANAVTGTREKLMDEGMDDFLSKPIVQTELRKQLAKWIPAHKRRPPDAAAGNAGDKTPPPPPAAPEADEPAHAPPPETKILRRLGAIPGLRLEDGLALMSDDVDLYLTVLKTVESMRRESTAPLPGLLADADAAAFATGIHGVKGALASIGAKDLSLRAYDMELAAKKGDLDLCRQKLPEFLEDFAAFSVTIADALAGAREDAKAEETAGVS